MTERGQSRSAGPNPETDPSQSDERRPENPTAIRVAIQGGGMRLAYGFGAMLPLRDRPELLVRSISCSSAGAVAPFILMADDPGQLIQRIFTMLSGRRFINPLRLRKIADIDYFVDEVLRPAVDVSIFDRSDTPDVWASVVDADDGSLRYVKFTGSNAFEVLRATAAVPVLYGRAVVLSDGHRYIDGGVADPLPLFHALSLCDNNDVLLAVATKPAHALGETSLHGIERWATLLDPRLPSDVRRLLLAPNPLAGATLRMFRQQTVGGVRIAACEPSDETLVFSRTLTKVTELERLRRAGQVDLSTVLDHTFGGELRT